LRTKPIKLKVKSTKCTLLTNKNATKFPACGGKSEKNAIKLPKTNKNKLKFNSEERLRREDCIASTKIA
jgi:hypothetical protein